MTKPSIGGIVHYVSYGTPGGEHSKECRAAIITEVHDDLASLCVLNPTGQFFNQGVPHDPGRHYSEIADPGTEPSGPQCDGQWHQGGTWHWPERTA